MPTPHIRTLRRALQALGTEERLAAALEISVADLEAYLHGKKPLPHAQFIDALDIVANSPRHTSSQE